MATSTAELRTAMLADLARSGLTIEDAKKLHLKPLTDAETVALGGMACLSYQIPYFDSSGRDTGFYRLRYLKVNGFARLVKKPQKYHQPANTLPQVYFATSLKWAPVLTDPTVPILITEGEKKAALASALGVPCLGLGGVWSWRAGKAGLSFLPALEEISWEGREVDIVFDSDGATNQNVRQAGEALAHALLQRSARPKLVFLPSDDPAKKVGLDDFLLLHKKKLAPLAKLVAAAEFITDAPELLAMAERYYVVHDLVCVLERSTNMLFKKADFIEVIEAPNTMTIQTLNGPKLVSTAQMFLKWAHRPEVRSLTYAPGQGEIVDGDYNLWKGWGCTPRKGDVKPFLKLLDYIFGSDKNALNWFLQWCAWPLVHPGKAPGFEMKMHTAVVFWSPARGTGKSLVARTLYAIHGAENSIKVTDKDLVGGFNAYAKNKTFIYGEEITGHAKADLANFLKDLISQPTVTVNEKFKPQYTLTDFANWMFLSNHSNAMLIDAKERRFMVQELHGSPKEEEFYTDYADNWLKKEGPAALFHHLLNNVDLTGFNPYGNAPETTSKIHMVEMGRTNVQRWLAELKDSPEDALPPEMVHFQYFEEKNFEQVFTSRYPLKESYALMSEVPNFFERAYRKDRTVAVGDGKSRVLWCRTKELAEMPHGYIVDRYRSERGMVSIKEERRANKKGKK